MPSLPHAAASIMEHLCNHDWHGYTQGNGRWGDGEGYCTVNVDGVDYQTAQGDRDCSSAVISAYQAAGLNVSATYTGDMRTGFTATGRFRWHPMSEGYIAKRGDIYLDETNHTAMCTSAEPDMLAEFSLNEFGGIVGGQVGDQTGRESSVHGYYNFPWDGILECLDGEAEPVYYPSATDAPESVSYAVYTEDDGWLPFVTDLEDFAGIQGHWIRHIAIDLHGHGWYQVKTMDGGWLPAVRACDTSDLANGCAGDGSPILAVRVYYETPDPGTTGWWCARYRVSNVYQDYFDWQNDDDSHNGQDGYAGDGINPIDRFQLYLSA